MNNDFKIHFTDGSTLVHYGKPRRSGRYKWGSGERPYQGDPEYQRKVRLKGSEKREIKRLNKMGAANYPDFYDRLSPAQRDAIEKGIKAGKISSEFKSKYDASKAGAGERAQKRKEEEIKRKMEEDQRYKETKEAFDTVQKNVKNFEDFDKMLTVGREAGLITDADDFKRYVLDADQEGWASKEFMTKFKAWDFANRYYDEEYDFFAIPDEIKRDIDGVIKDLEDRYYKNGEFVSTGDDYKDKNIQDARWRLQQQKDPNTNPIPPSMREYYENEQKKDKMVQWGNQTVKTFENDYNNISKKLDGWIDKHGFKHEGEKMEQWAEDLTKKRRH